MAGIDALTQLHRCGAGGDGDDISSRDWIDCFRPQDWPRLDSNQRQLARNIFDLDGPGLNLEITEIIDFAIDLRIALGDYTPPVSNSSLFASTVMKRLVRRHRYQLDFSSNGVHSTYEDGFAFPQPLQDEHRAWLRKVHPISVKRLRALRRKRRTARIRRGAW